MMLFYSSLGIMKWFYLNYFIFKYIEINSINYQIQFLGWYFWISSGSKSAKYGCFKAYFIEILLDGSRASIFMHKSNPTLSKFLK